MVGGFDPSAVQPVNATATPCPECVAWPCPCPFPWLFDHRGTYGEDGLLSPDETSTPVEWVLSDPPGESFSFRARVQLGSSTVSGTIAGLVFVDENANGLRDPAEIGIAGAPVSLVSGATTQTTLTDEHGRYAFVVSEPGLYEVTREPAGDCQPTTPNRRQVFIVARADGSLSGFDHANFGCGGGPVPDMRVFFVGMVYNDLNRDGVHQMGEPGVAGIGVTGSSGCPTFAAIRTFTDGRGAYQLVVPRCAPPYVVGHDPLPGFVDTSPNPLVFGDPGVVPGDSVPGGPPTDPPMPPLPPVRLLHADFGIAPGDSTNQTSVEGFVYRDANRNGQMDAGEPGTAGVRVTAGSLVCMIPAIGVTTTDERGHYRLTEADVRCILPWSVQHDPLPGGCDTSPNPVIIGGMPGSTPPLPGTGQFHVDFGVAACDTVPTPTSYGITGLVFLDMDGDGQHDPGEPGIPGAGLSLESVCLVWRATQTDASGHYSFAPRVVAMCPVGAVRQYAPDFPMHTTPNPFPVDPNSVPPGAVLNVDFGIRPIRDPQR
jgi:hypothetical protein